MIKNNLKSFLIHVIISFFSIIVFFMFSLSQAKWASEEAANRHHNLMMIIAIVLIIIALILYYLSGRLLLINQGSLYKNLLATISVAIIGIIIWVIAYKIDFIARGGYLINSDLWQFYCIYNGYSLFFLNESESNNHFIFLLFSFMPTLAMAFGMLKKRNIKTILS